MAVTQTSITGEVKCPACGSKFRVAAPVTLYRLKDARVSVRTGGVYFVHECPAVTPRRRR